MTTATDVIVVGGGIMGLAFAWEAAVLAEFATRAPDLGVPCELLPGAEAVRRFPSLAPDARAVLWSPTEVVVDPPRAIAAVAAHLQRMHGVDIHFSTTVVGVQMPRVITSRGERFEAPPARMVGRCPLARRVRQGPARTHFHCRTAARLPRDGLSGRCGHDACLRPRRAVVEHA